MAGRITASGTLNGRQALRSEEIRQQRELTEVEDTVLRLRQDGSSMAQPDLYDALYIESLQNVSPGDGGSAAGGDAGAGASGSGDGSGAVGDGGSGSGDGGTGDGGSGDGGTGGPAGGSGSAGDGGAW